MYTDSGTFQSTRPIRGATLCNKRLSNTTKDFNPRAPYGARRRGFAVWSRLLCISIHAPHTGRDGTAETAKAGTTQFQSTRPIRGATRVGSYVYRFWDISIHAPHTGRDSLRMLQVYMTSYFNPRAPYGARRPGFCGFCGSGYFNPRAPYGARLTI